MTAKYESTTTPFDFNAEYTHALEHIDSLRKERDRLKGQVEQLREALNCAIERLEASQPPENGATDQTIVMAKSAMLCTGGLP